MRESNGLHHVLFCSTGTFQDGQPHPSGVVIPPRLIPIVQDRQYTDVIKYFRHMQGATPILQKSPRTIENSAPRTPDDKAVLRPSGGSDLDSAHMCDPTVVKGRFSPDPAELVRSSKIKTFNYVMYYSANNVAEAVATASRPEPACRGKTNLGSRVFAAFSSDLLTWVRATHPVIVPEPGAPCVYGVGQPSAVISETGHQALLRRALPGAGPSDGPPASGGLADPVARERPTGARRDALRPRLPQWPSHCLHGAVQTVPRAQPWASTTWTSRITRTMTVGTL